MADSIRQQIRAEIITLLKGITIANGFNFDVGEVSRKLKGYMSVKPTDFPALYVINTNERKTDGDVDDLINNMVVQVIGYVKDHKDTTDEIDKLAADVEKAICADPKRELGGIKGIVNVVPSEIKTDEGTLTPYGVMQFNFEVTYHQLYGTP